MPPSRAPLVPPLVVQPPVLALPALPGAGHPGHVPPGAGLSWRRRSRMRQSWRRLSRRRQSRRRPSRRRPSWRCPSWHRRSWPRTSERPPWPRPSRPAAIQIKLYLFLKLLGPGAENWRNSWFLHRVYILLKRKFCHYFFKQNFRTNFDFLTQSLSWGSYILNSHRKIDNPVIAFNSMNAKLLNATLKSLVLKT